MNLFIVILTLGIVWAPSLVTCAQDSDGTQEIRNQLSNAIRSSRLSHIENMIPLQQKQTEERRKVRIQLDSNQEIVRRFENRNRKALEATLESVIKEKERLLLRIQQLNKLETILIDKTPDAIPAAVKNAKMQIKKLTSQSSEIRRANRVELDELNSRFANNRVRSEKSLAKLLNEKFEGKYDGIQRTFVIWNYLSATATVRYQKPDLRDITISINFRPDQKRTVSNKDQVFGRFPIRKKSKTSLDFYVHDVFVNVSIFPGNDRTSEPFDLEEFFAAAFDVDSFEKQIKLANE